MDAFLFSRHVQDGKLQSLIISFVVTYCLELTSVVELTFVTHFCLPSHNIMPLIYLSLLYDFE